MQKTLTFNHKGKKYVSKPFDWKAMCLINEGHNDEKRNGPLMMCTEAADYMFEGTEATQDIIEELDLSQRTKLCTTLWTMYIDVLTAKND